MCAGTLRGVRVKDNPFVSGWSRIARSCPHSTVEEWAKGRPRLRHLAVHAVIPAVRAIVRYAPSRRIRAGVWNQAVRPLWGHDHPFAVRIDGGSKVAGTTAETVAASIYFTGAWEEPLTRWLTARLRPGDTFIDVGAHIGYFAVVASRLVGESGRVVAIEPLRASFEQLGRNVALNRARNIRAVNVAVLDRESELVLWAHPRNPGATFTDPPNPGYRREAAVEARPLTEILESDEIARARVIKIDVEGSEAAVVEGMTPLLSATRDDLEVLVELHPVQLERAGSTPEAIGRAFERAGFRGAALPSTETRTTIGADGAEILTTEQIVFSRVATGS
jgi:FkbM family methyltransferase